MDTCERYDLEGDVVVIGGSGAAVSAALAAAEVGAKVILLSKGKVGRSGNAIISTANISMDGESAYRMGEKRADRRITPKKIFEGIVTNSFFLSEQYHAAAFAENCGRAVKDFIETGRRIGERFIFIPPSGWITSGRAIGRINRYRLRSTESVTFLEDVMVTDILTVRNRAAGVLGVELKSGRLILAKARAVIVASGGFQPFSFKCTSSDTTGDGLAMALRAGAGLSDMEFQLFLPGVLVQPLNHRGSIFPFLWYVGGFATPDILDEKGRRIIDSYERSILEKSLASKWFKLIHAYYWARAQGPLYFDFGSVKRMKYLVSVVRENILLKLMTGERWRYQGEDFRDLHEMVKRGERWKVSMSSEYSMGGILVERNMETSVEGLFACGEAASGFFGAFRGERALTEVLIEGEIAGREAARFAMGSSFAEPGREWLAERINMIAVGKGKEAQMPDYFEMSAELERLADYGFGALRREETMREALDGVRKVREALDMAAYRGVKPGYDTLFIERVRVENLAICLEAGLLSALKRRESRGMHMRSDYEEVDNENFLYRSVVSLREDGRIELSRKKPDCSVIEPPSGREAGIIDYIRRYP